VAALAVAMAVPVVAPVSSAGVASFAAAVTTFITVASRSRVAALAGAPLATLCASPGSSPGPIFCK
jgi:hypothetical protein